MNSDLFGRLEALPLAFPSMETVPDKMVYLMGCRTFSQFCCTLRALLDPYAFCPFCTRELERRKRKPSAVVGEWMVMLNEFPHKNTSQMWLILPQRHVVHPGDLDEQDWVDIGKSFAICRTRVPDGGVMFRFGDPHYNVGTVEHMHINVIKPVCGKEYRAPFAKDASEHAQDYGRLLGFREALCRHNDPTSWLFSAEGIENTQPAVG